MEREKLMFDKQVFAGPSIDNETRERTLIKMALLVPSCQPHLELSMVIAPSWDRPSTLNSFRQLEGRTKFLSESFVPKNNQAKETHFGVANSELP